MKISDNLPAKEAFWKIKQEDNYEQKKHSKPNTDRGVMQLYRVVRLYCRSEQKGR